MIKINRIIIESKGDIDSGMPSMLWTIEQELYIDQDYIQSFQEELKVAWEYIADDIVVNFEFDGIPLLCPLKK